METTVKELSRHQMALLNSYRNRYATAKSINDRRIEEHGKPHPWAEEQMQEMKAKINGIKAR